MQLNFDDKLQVKGDVVWSKPSSDLVRINVDVAVSSSYLQNSLGFVLRDSAGLLIKVRASCLPVRYLPREAEAIGVREALSWLKEEGLDNFIVETYSFQVVQAISHPCVVSPFGFIISECVDLLKHFNRVLVRFVYRTTNSATHACA